MNTADLTIYLRPTGAIDSDNPRILENAKRLTVGCGVPEEKAVRLFYFVRDEIHYNVYMISTNLEDFKASATLEREKGYCVQKAVLLAALARAAGIPSRLAFAKIRNHRAPARLVELIGTNVLRTHGYSQLYLRGAWVSATPAFDRELCERNGLPLVEFDGVHDALLAERDIAGRPHIEYLEKYEPQHDLPFAWLMEWILPVWGEKRSWLKDEDGKGYVMPSGFVF